MVDICLEPGCQIPANIGSYCITHHPPTSKLGLLRDKVYKNCAEPGCPAQAIVGSWCREHLYKKCGEPGCEERAAFGSLCVQHHPPTAGMSIKVDGTLHESCKEAACWRPVLESGFCDLHAPVFLCSVKGCSAVKLAPNFKVCSEHHFKHSREETVYERTLPQCPYCDYRFVPQEMEVMFAGEEGKDECLQCSRTFYWSTRITYILQKDETR